MIPIDYVCYLNESGYSQAAQDMVMAIDSLGIFDIRITCIHGNIVKKSFSNKSYDYFSSLCKKEENNKAIQIFHCIPEKQKRFIKKNKSISFATFETYNPPDHWIRHLNSMDAVICPSEFNYKIFAHAGVKKPIFHIPHCINTEKWNTNVKSNKKDDVFTFLFLGTWRKRKGYEVLLEAWYREFSTKDKVRLVIHTDSGSSKKALLDSINIKRNIGLEKKDTSPIFIEDNIIEDEHLPLYMKSFDCVICPSFGEGFGLPGLQSMALGVPLIITDFGGCLDYASEERCTFIKHSGFIIHDCLDNIPQFKNKKWPRITVKEVSNTMRYVLNNYSIVFNKSKEASEYVINNFNYNKIACQFKNLLETVYRV